MRGGVQQIWENLYCFQDACQVYLIKKGDRAVLIDFGTGGILDVLWELGICKAEAVFITHHHRDQAEGIARAVKAGIPVFVPETEYELFTEASGMWQNREIYNNYNNRQDRFSILESVKAEPLRDYGTYRYLGMEFHVIPTPGHTTGSISIETCMEGISIAFTGDLIYGPGKVWSLAATQWSYNGGEGIPYTILSLLDIRERKIQWMFPSHGVPMKTEEAAEPTAERLAELMKLRLQNPRLFQLREHPYERITEHVLFNRTSMANSYVLLSESKKALFIDFGYDFMAGAAAGTERSSRRPWLYTLPALKKEFGVESVDACIPTHYHDDHVAGINLLKREYGTTVICPESYAGILEHPERYDLPCLWYEPVETDRKVRYGVPFQWEEYELTVYPLPGHTRFASAICFQADGETFLCTGDQYAGDDGQMPNYVYKNIFDYDDFCKSAELYRRLAPDWILSGHWPKKKPDQAFYDALEKRGREVAALRRSLLPEEGNQNPGNDFPVIFLPYQNCAEAGKVFEAEIRVLQETEEEMRLELVLSDGFSCEKPVYTLQKGERAHIFTLYAPSVPVRRARVGCRLWLGRNCRGTLAEMLVDVRKQGERGV